ncbi:7-cyano-7-deazaguanine synthase [Leptospira kanakyensis]|uniref:7-cyano-7-deazaguanine synthase n=1 Tax=Leptospira kanakyensis TaxID=2484968 RepID=UPI00223CBE2D|nr:7-cyano-7-deazaguanine synthase [Leptospira kanakyensis]MCW7470554.1 7-cyano-7-deazaguanine synthase [Leptospira kanakyensis]
MLINILVKTKTISKDKLENRRTYRFRLNKREYNLSINTNISSSSYGVRNAPERILDLNGIVNTFHLINRFVLKSQRDDVNLKIQVTFPVKDLDFWNTELVKKKLEELLIYFTDIRWNINFILDNSSHTHPNPKLPFKKEEELEICFWSGGLDSYAGLIDRLSSFPRKEFIVASFESNNSTKSIQNDVFLKLKKIYPNLTERIYIHNSFNHKNKNEFPYARTRGLFFLLSGMSLAFLLGQNKIYMYENGMGALNLMLPGNYGLDQSITATFQSQRLCEEFFTLVTDTEIKIENPYAFQTKSEMLRNILEKKLTNFISITSSCDSPQRKKPKECGFCTSCLLRRFSLLSAGIEDEKDYIFKNLFESELENKNTFQAMSGQVRIFDSLLRTDSLDTFFDYFPDLHRSQEYSRLDKNLFRQKLRSFLELYIDEWKKFEAKLYQDEELATSSKLIA